MTENIFSAVLTFSLLAGGAVAFGSELAQPDAQKAVQATTLPAVTVIGQRIAAADRLTLPAVMVVGRRCTPTELAAETRTVEHRVQ